MLYVGQLAWSFNSYILKTSPNQQSTLSIGPAHTLLHSVTAPRPSIQPATTRHLFFHFIEIEKAKILERYSADPGGRAGGWLAAVPGKLAGIDCQPNGTACFSSRLTSTDIEALYDLCLLCSLKSGVCLLLPSMVSGEAWGMVWGGYAVQVRTGWRERSRTEYALSKAGRNVYRDLYLRLIECVL